MPHPTQPTMPAAEASQQIMRQAGTLFAFCRSYGLRSTERTMASVMRDLGRELQPFIDRERLLAGKPARSSGERQRRRLTRNYDCNPGPWLKLFVAHNNVAVAFASGRPEAVEAAKAMWRRRLWELASLGPVPLPQPEVVVQMRFSCLGLNKASQDIGEALRSLQAAG